MQTSRTTPGEDLQNTVGKVYPRVDTFARRNGEAIEKVNLIADGLITPMIAVMIDSAENRSAWYSYNPDYLRYLEKVVACVDSRYSTRAEARRASQSPSFARLD